MQHWPVTVGTPRKKKSAEGWCYCSRRTVGVGISRSSVTFLNVIVTCFCTVVKFAHLEWKSMDNAYFEIIRRYFEEKHCKVFLVYSDHEEMAFDRAVTFLFNRLEHTCLSPIWFMSRWLWLIALKMWISWGSSFTASAVARKPINYSAKKPWKVNTPPAGCCVGKSFADAWVCSKKRL